MTNGNLSPDPGDWQGPGGTSSISGGKDEQYLQNFIRAKTDPLFWLEQCVFTLDQVDSQNPIKAFPAQKEYLRLYAKLWERFRLIAVPKSRRMTMSWTNIALYTREVIFMPGRAFAFVSKKEDDAGDLVGRAEFIYNKIPKHIIPPDLLPKIDGGKAKKSPPRLQFPEINSWIGGFARGADQLRQYTFSGLLGDECAFWDDAESFYSASKPTLDGGGRMTLISSRAPGFFKKIVFDKLQAKDLHFPEIPPVPAKKLMTGVEVWQNPDNRFLVFECHYSADPEKRAPEFREALRRTLPKRQFEMEYEKAWNTFEGLPVYEDYRADLHEADGLEPELGLPLLIGWDFGLTPAAIVGQMQGNRLIILKEFIGKNVGISKFYPKVMREVQQRYPQQPAEDIIHFIDPAGFGKAQTDERTCAGVMEEHGAKNVFPGPIVWEDRKKAVETLLMYVDKDGAGITLDRQGCPLLIEGFKGGYRYPDSAGDVEPSKIRPLKDAYCVGMETEILTARGWLSYNKVNIGEQIYEYDIEKEQIILGSVRELNVFDNQDLTRYSNQNNTLTMTSEHRCVVRSKNTGKLSFKRARELAGTDLFVSPKGKFEAPKKNLISDEIVRLAAWVMTEGTLRNAGSYILCQSHKHNLHHVQAIEELIEHFPNCYAKTGTKTMAQWYIGGDAAFMLRQFLKGKTKIPTNEFINLMNNRQRRLFLFTCLCGDGDNAHKLDSRINVSKNRKFLEGLRGTTARIKLKQEQQISQLQFMATLAGLRTSMKKSRDGVSLTILRKHEATYFESLRQETLPKQTVWCPTTQTGTWICRTGGRVYVTGNSHPADALQYLAYGAQEGLQSHTIDIANPAYSFIER